MRLFLSAFLLSVLPLATAVPQGPPLSTGPYGGYVQHLARDSSGRVYAATFMGGIYRTSNDGDLWEDLYNDTLLIDVRTLAIGSGGTIYAGLDPGFLRSTDDGASWQKLSNLLNTRSVVSILILPCGTLLAGTISNGVYRSTDNGATFSSSDDSLTNSYVWSLAATPSGDTVYAATYGGGVFRSINGGSTWSPVNTGLTQNLVTWVGIAPDGALFACAGASIFRSTDNGDNWTDLSPPPASYRSIEFTSGAYYAPSTSGVFTGGSVFVSTDGGVSWNPDPGLPGQYYLSIAHSGGTIFAGAGGHGVYRRPALSGTQVSGTQVSGTHGSWTHVVQGMANTLITSLAFDTNGALFAGTRFAGVFRSADSGATWMNVSDTIPAAEWINDIAVSPVTGTVFAAGVYNSYRSTDGGDTWPVSTMGQTDMVACNPEGVVFSSLGGNIRRSTDDGMTWSGLNLSGVSSIKEAAFRDSAVYLATGVAGGFGASRGVWRSTDLGGTWAAYNDSLPDLNVVAVAVVDTSSVLKRSAGGAGVCDEIVLAATRNGSVYGLDVDTWVPAGNGIVPQFQVTGMYGDRWPASKNLFLYGDRGELAERPDVSCDWIKKHPVRLYAEVRAVVLLRSPGESALYGTMGGGVINITTSTTGVETAPGIPERFALHQNYPNPFNPGTTIRFDMAAAGHVAVRIYDVLGRETAVLVDRFETPGVKTVDWDASGAPGGVYFVRLTAGEHREMRKMVLLR